MADYKLEKELSLKRRKAMKDKIDKEIEKREKKKRLKKLKDWIKHVTSFDL